MSWMRPNRYHSLPVVALMKPRRLLGPMNPSNLRRHHTHYHSLPVVALLGLLKSAPYRILLGHLESPPMRLNLVSYSKRSVLTVVARSSCFRTASGVTSGHLRCVPRLITRLSAHDPAHVPRVRL